MNEDLGAMAHLQSSELVHVHDTVRMVDGSVHAPSRENGSLELTAGSGEVVERVSLAGLAMTPGRRPFHHASGKVSPQAGRREIPVRVGEIRVDHAALDGNHPRADRNLIYEIELVSFHS